MPVPYPPSLHQEITRAILCRLIYIIMSFRPFIDITMIVCKFLIELCHLEIKRHIFLSDIHC